MSSSLQRLSLQQLHNNTIQQISSMEGKFGIISVLKKYNDELVRRNEHSLSQYVSQLISEVRGKQVDGPWVIAKVQGIPKQQFSQKDFQKQQQMEFMDHSLTDRGFASSKNMASLSTKVTTQSFVIDPKRWATMDNFRILDEIINAFRTIDDFNVVLHGLDELRHQLASTLASLQMRKLSAYINDLKKSKTYETQELIGLLRNLQNEYR